MRVVKDLVAASATPMVLGILAEGDNYGYAIIRRVAELSGGELEWSEGLLYPLLHRLERDGLVSSHWGVAETNRRRKYYHLTERGHDAVAEHRKQWDVVVEALRAVWPEPPVTPVVAGGQ